MRHEPTGSSGRPRRWASSITLRATAVLQSRATVAIRSWRASMRRTSIHSEMSKLPCPVMASTPRAPLKLLFSGRLPEAMAPISALVTQGGLPRTRSGSGRLAISSSQRVVKKSAVVTRDRSSGRRRRASITCASLMSNPRSSAPGSRAAAASRKAPTPQVGSSTARGGSGEARSTTSTTARARMGGVCQSP